MRKRRLVSIYQSDVGRYFLSFILSVLAIFSMACRNSSSESAMDWPMWRFDSNRTAATPFSLPENLFLQWVREFPLPQPAFPDEPQMRFDGTYEPVVKGSIIYVPCMVSDSVKAFDTATGEEIWTFFTDAPVRLAPLAWRDKLYVVSDDGWLYCLTAKGGHVLWKFRGASPEYVGPKILGNGRLISRWPARGGPVMSDGILYFTAGIWPFEGVFLHALDGETGRLVWTNKDISLIKNGMLDHDARRDGGLVPQGYLSIIGEKLIVPSGQSLPGFFDPRTGIMEPYTSGWGGREFLAKGNWYTSGIGCYYFQNGDLFELTPNDSPKTFKGPWKGNYLSGYGSVYGHPESMYVLANRPRLQVDPANARHTGIFRDPVLTEEAMYYSIPVNKYLDQKNRSIGDGFDGIVAYDFSKKALEERKVNVNTIDVTWNLTVFEELWSMPSDLKVHIKAGPRLYAGAEGIVASITIPESGEKPTVSWRSDEIQGLPVRMLAADNRLFVMTDGGRLFCFGGNDIPAGKTIPVPDRFSVQADEWTDKATRILDCTEIQGGYCVSLGLGTGRLVEELATQSELMVIVIESDGEKVETARRKYDRAGLYGHRIHILAGTLDSLKLPPFMADVIVAENPAVFDRMNPDEFSLLYGLLRPYGGMVKIESPVSEQPSLLNRLQSLNLYGAEIHTQDDMILLRRQGGLPGAADWSHETGDAGNTLASRDQLGLDPMGILWFGASIDGIFPDYDYTHSRPPIPLVMEGRMFIQVKDSFHATDIYTGRHLWTAPLPPQDRRRGGCNAVAAEDSVYVVFGKTIARLDPVTGLNLETIGIPSGILHDPEVCWREIRLQGDRIMGILDNQLLCLDRRNGNLKWKQECRQVLYSVAAGGNSIFYSDFVPREDRSPQGKGIIYACEIETGRILWSCSENAEKTSFQPILFYNSESDVLIALPHGDRVCAYRGKDGTVLWTKDIPDFYPPILHHEVLIAHSGEMFEPETGLPSPTRMWRGVNTWYDLTGGTRSCGYAIASEHLVFLRDAFSHYYDIKFGIPRYLRGIRSGCTPSLVPAGGVINAPNYARGCSCGFGMYTSFALAPIPEAKSWEADFSPENGRNKPAREVPSMTDNKEE